VPAGRTSAVAAPRRLAYPVGVLTLAAAGLIVPGIVIVAALVLLAVLLRNV
jgi:hypothetical protein